MYGTRLGCDEPWAGKSSVNNKKTRTKTTQNTYFRRLILFFYYVLSSILYILYCRVYKATKILHLSYMCAGTRKGLMTLRMSCRLRLSARSRKVAKRCPMLLVYQAGNHLK